jgi:hypothetical protein
MESANVISIRLDTVDQLVEPCAPSPFRRRRLKEEAEKFLVERAGALPRETAIKLEIALPKSEEPKSGAVVEAIHEHFNFLCKETETKLARMQRLGWRSLAIAFAFLTTAMLFIQWVTRYFDPRPFSSAVIEGLTVLAWIALWRPGELLLYERDPFKRDARLFRKLEQCEVRFSFDDR